LLIALVGIAAARGPFSNRRRFQQLLQGNQYNQRGGWGQQFDDEDDTCSSWDSDDECQTQQQRYQRWGQFQDDEDQYMNQDQDDYDQDEQGYCQPGDLNCYGSGQQGQGYCQPGDLDCYGSGQQGQGQGQQHQCRPNYQLLQKLEKPNCHIAAKLYKQAKLENDDKNTVVSPAALQLTLAALQKGARGSTKTQIKRVQCPTLSQQQCQQAHAALIRTLKATNNVQQTQRPGQQNSQQKAKINCPTAIIVNQQTQAQRQFVQTVQKCLGCQVQKCSFKHGPQQCRQKINQLISAKTNQKLHAVVPPQACTTNTKMIAVSAMQLQAKWGQQFRQQQTTKQGRFYPLGSQQPKQCQVIQSQGNFNYYEDDQVQVVGIPTQQQELTMYVILPKCKDCLTQVEKQQIQNGDQLKQLLDSCDQQTQYLQVQLPKFQAKHKLDAKKTLLQQGVQDAFDNDAADFSGIIGQQQQQWQQQQGNTQVHLNKVIHQATIKVTEQGISSANTGSQDSFLDQIGGSQWQQDDQDEYGTYQQGQFGQNQFGRNQFGQNQFGRNQYGQGLYGQEQFGQYSQGNQVKVNHAFAFAVKHNPSNQIVLVGRVVDPTQKPHGQQQQLGQFRGQYQDQDDDMIDQE